MALIEVYSIAFIIMRITGRTVDNCLQKVPRDVEGKLLGQLKDSNWDAEAGLLRLLVRRFSLSLASYGL